MKGSEKKSNLVKVCIACFSFRESCDFLLDYKEFINSNYDEQRDEKFIKISFNHSSDRNRKLHFKCRYKMMTNCDRSLN